MTQEEFNKKYSKYLEKEHKLFHDGLSFDIPEFTEWLDEKFQEFIKEPNFNYSQIKVKFGMGRFYCEGLSNEQIFEIEDKITELCKKN